MIEIRRYVTETGKAVFGEWIESLRDRAAIARIFVRIDRLAKGNRGDCKSVGEGIFELRIDFGPGYRVYFAQFGETLILLLSGGDKSTQEQDIRNAKFYWQDYKRREATRNLDR